jgi:hypothetical protein
MQRFNEETLVQSAAAWAHAVAKALSVLWEKIGQWDGFDRTGETQSEELCPNPPANLYPKDPKEIWIWDFFLDFYRNLQMFIFCGDFAAANSLASRWRRGMQAAQGAPICISKWWANDSLTLSYN